MFTEALFVLIRDTWRFEGFSHSPELTRRFVKSVEKDIKETKDSQRPTVTYRIVPLSTETV